MSLTLPFQSIRHAVLVLTLLAAAAASRADEVDADDWIVRDVDVRAIAQHAEDSLRGERAFMRAQLTVGSPKRSQPRAIDLTCWTDRVAHRSLLRILSPRSAAGAAYLYLPPNLWHYDPEQERTQLASPSALLDAWMGSDFALGDLLDTWSAIEDYDVELLDVEPPSESTGGQRSYVVQYMPRPSARGAWSKVIAWIETDGGALLRKEFYAANGEKLRTLGFGAIRAVGNRRVPYRWTAIRSGEKRRESILEIRELRFEPSFDDAIFSTRNLRPSRDGKPNG